MDVKLPSLLDDKDKLILVVNVYIKDLSRQREIAQLHQFLKEYFESKFDDTVKVLVMPVLCEEYQGIEVLNPIFADKEMLDRLNNNYEEILKKLNEKNSL